MNMKRELTNTALNPMAKNKSSGSKIIKTIVRDGREYQLHATKGWRSRKAKGENI